MKYTFAVYTQHDETGIEKEVSIRADASLKTVVKKAADEMAEVLVEKGLLAYPVTYMVDMPNVWRNGGLGTLRVQDDKDYFFIGIRHSDSEAWMFL